MDIIPLMRNLLAPIPDSYISFATNNIWDKFGQVSEGNIKTFSLLHSLWLNIVNTTSDARLHRNEK